MLLRDRKKIKLPILEEKNGSDLVEFPEHNIGEHICEGNSARDELIFPSRIGKDIFLRSLTIVKSVVDLRTTAEDISPLDFSHNDSRLTQLLYNDRVQLIRKEGQWLFVGAIAQSCYREKRGWHAYEGWIHHTEAKELPLLEPTHVVKEKGFFLGPLYLSYGTHLTVQDGEQPLTAIPLPSGAGQGQASNLNRTSNLLPIHRGVLQVLLPTGERFPIPSPSALRPLTSPLNKSELCKEASLFLNDPYLWGGASAPSHPWIASVDCSGLIYLLYRAQNYLLPRDAHDQWLKTHPIKKEELLPGDLLFLSREDKPERITHVLLCVKEGWLMESPMTGEAVRTFPIDTHLKEEGRLITLKGRERRYFPHYRRLS